MKRKIEKDKELYFVKGTFRKFFLPSIFSSLWIALGGVADCFFVGNGIGSEGLAAVSFGMPVYLFYNILSYGMSIGGSIHFSSSVAKGEEKEGVRIFNSVFKCLLVLYVATVALAMLFLPQFIRLLGANPANETVRTYIRTQLIFIPVMFSQGPFYYFVHNDNNPGLAALSLSLSNVVDIVLNYILVVRLQIGVQGSVYATVAGACLMLTLTGSHIIRRKGVLRFTGGGIDWSIAWNAMKTGLATSIQYFYQFITMIVVNRMLMNMSGITGVAAFDVIYNISTLFLAVTEAVSMTLEPMLSSYRSERNIGNIRNTLKISFRHSIGLGLLFILLIGGAAEQLVVWFGLSGMPELGYGVAGIRIYMASVLLMIVNTTFGYYYQSIEVERISYLITTLRTFVCYLAAVFWCGRFGINGFWWHFLVAEALTLLIWAGYVAWKKDWLQLKSIDTSQVKAIFINSSDTDIGRIIEEVEVFCQQKKLGGKNAYYISLVIEEICCAIMEQFKESMDEIYIQLTVVIEGEGCSLYLRDNALAFNPFDMDTNSLDLKQAHNVESLGMKIVKQKAKEFFYRRYVGFNALVVKL